MRFNGKQDSVWTALSEAHSQGSRDQETLIRSQLGTSRFQSRHIQSQQYWAYSGDRWHSTGAEPPTAGYTDHRLRTRYLTRSDVTASSTSPPSSCTMKLEAAIPSMMALPASQHDS